MNRYNDELDEFTEQRRKVLMSILGKRIRRLRLTKGLTQELVAEKAACNPKYLGEVEAGKKSPGALLLNKIALALDVPVCSLLTDGGCSYVGGDAAGKVGKIFAGKEPEEIRRAVRIIEVLFDEAGAS